MYQERFRFATALNRAELYLQFNRLPAKSAIQESMGGIGPYVWDDEKHASNLARHGIDFATATGFDWDRSIIWQDRRRDYGERRFLALAKLATRVHLMVFTLRGGYLRIISLRKANRREVRRYEEES